MVYFPDFVAIHKLAAPAAPAVAPVAVAPVEAPTLANDGDKTITAAPAMAPVAVAPVEASPLAKDGDKTNTQVSSSPNPASATLTMLLAGWCLASIVRF